MKLVNSTTLVEIARWWLNQCGFSDWGLHVTYDPQGLTLEGPSETSHSELDTARQTVKITIKRAEEALLVREVLRLWMRRIMLASALPDSASAPVQALDAFAEALATLRQAANPGQESP